MATMVSKLCNINVLGDYLKFRMVNSEGTHKQPVAANASIAPMLYA